MKTHILPVHASNYTHRVPNDGPRRRERAGISSGSFFTGLSRAGAGRRTGHPPRPLPHYREKGFAKVPRTLPPVLDMASCFHSLNLRAGAERCVLIGLRWKGDPPRVITLYLYSAVKKGMYDLSRELSKDVGSQQKSYCSRSSVTYGAEGSRYRVLGPSQLSAPAPGDKGLAHGAIVERRTFVRPLLRASRAVLYLTPAYGLLHRIRAEMRPSSTTTIKAQTPATNGDSLCSNPSLRYYSTSNSSPLRYAFTLKSLDVKPSTLTRGRSEIAKGLHHRRYDQPPKPQA
ncbi:hypothetical protein EVAR_59523_1 [Eumeta japonica]|uniref:Uncharacterized protein n=1 Tax=Eumeta variegata TaxID=151549 RepID=A0A4C1XS93_EUMVA|nr:hypothetical protein EVAR_59523_1 [Eumeta japonica]